MVCRCTSSEMHAQREAENLRYSQRQAEQSHKDKVAKLEKDLAALTPDPTKWELVDFLENGSYFIAKVKFQTCEHAGYGGHKVLVFKATTKEAILWRYMDPHFKEAKSDKAVVFNKTVAPVPIARFPASPEGWEDAKAFVRIKIEQTKNVGIRGGGFNSDDYPY